MKIYKVSRTDRTDYDEYDEMVVVAAGEYEAMELANRLAGKNWKTNQPYFSTNTATVVEVNTDSHPGVVVASYNAG